MNAFLIASFFVILSAQGLPGQRPTRVVESYDSPWAGGADGLEWALDSVGVVRFIDPSSRSSASAASGISNPGGMYAMPDAMCLLCGADAAGNGALELWEFVSPGVLVLRATRTDAGADYVGVVHDADASTLYLLDANTSTLLRGTWDGVSGLDTIVLESFASSAALPELAAASECTLVTAGTGVLCLVPWQMWRTPAGSKITMASGAFTVESWTGSQEEGYDAYVVPVETTEDGSQVIVKATVGVAFDIVKLSDGTVIGSGVGQGPSSPVTVTISAPLILGERYAARVVGTPVPTNLAFECVRRYGLSDSLSDGTTMRPFFYQRGASAGNVLNVQLLLQAPVRPVDIEYDGFLLVAFRAPTDPVVQIGANYLLDPDFAVQVKGWVMANARQGSVAVDVPVPHGLDGLVFLVQFWLVDGSEFKFSQIYGSPIKPM